MMPGAMQEWLEAVSIADVIGGLISLGVLVAGLRWLRPIAGGLRAIAEDWKGTPARPGRPAVPGVMEQLAAHAQAIEEIRYHVQPNHGGSAHDALSRKVDDLRQLVADLAAAFGEHLRQDATDEEDRGES